MLFDSVRFVFCAQTVKRMVFKGSAIRKKPDVYMTWRFRTKLLYLQNACTKPSFKNTRSTGIMPSVLYCNAALQQGTGNFEDLFCCWPEKNMNMRHNMFHVTMGEVSE